MSLMAVTGASGHIGSNLVRQLLDAGHRVRVLHFEDSRGFDGLPVEIVKGDVREPASLLPLCDGADVVFHLAGRISISSRPDARLTEVNVRGTEHVVAAVRRTRAKRMVHFSSIHALSPYPEDGPVVETRPLNDGDDALPYDRSKAQSEKVVQDGIADGLDAVIVNPCGGIGPLDYKPSALGAVLVALSKGAMPALVSGGFNWVDVRDVARGAILAAEKGKTGQRYLLSGHYLKVHELAKVVERISGTRAPRFVCPMWLARLGAPFAEFFARLRKKEPAYTSGSLRALRHHQLVSGERADKELGYAPRPNHDTVADTLAWFAGAHATASAQKAA